MGPQQAPGYGRLPLQGRLHPGRARHTGGPRQRPTHEAERGSGEKAQARMRLSVLGDIHANLYALQAVLADIDRGEPGPLYHVGDLVGYAPFADEVVDLITTRDIRGVRGNYDDAVGYAKDSCGCKVGSPRDAELTHSSLQWTLNHTSDRTRNRLLSLPDEIRIDAAGRSVVIVHGSPRRINEYVLEDRTDESLLRLAEAAAADVLIYGHTHLPYHRAVEDRHFINVGSVGRPVDGDARACWALINLGAHVAVHFHRVGYDVEAAAGAVRGSGLPEEFADVLIHGGKVAGKGNDAG